MDAFEEMREISVRCTVSGWYLHWLLTEAGEDTFAEVEVGMDPAHVGYGRWTRPGQALVPPHRRDDARAVARHAQVRRAATGGRPVAGARAPAAAACPETSLGDLEDEVMCPVCGTSLGLATEAPQAQRERAFIQRLIDQCKTKEEVKTALVAEFGDEVLALARTTTASRSPPT